MIIELLKQWAAIAPNEIRIDAVGDRYRIHYPFSSLLLSEDGLTRRERIALAGVVIEAMFDRTQTDGWKEFHGLAYSAVSGEWCAYISPHGTVPTDVVEFASTQIEALLKAYVRAIAPVEVAA